MAESIHDWAVKLGMVTDSASFSAAEKLQDNFTASIVKSNERIKASNEDRVRAEQQAQKMREGEKIRQANLSPEDLRDERKVRLGGLYTAGAVDAQLFVKELNNINAAYTQQRSVIEAAAAAEQAASAQSVRNATFNREARREASDRWKESIDAAGRASDVERRRTAQRLADEAVINSAIEDQIRIERNQSLIEEGAAERLNTIRASELRHINNNNNAVNRATNLLRVYGNHANQVAIDIHQLNVARDRGTITERQHAVATTEATRRMQNARGGLGNLGYAFGEASRGAEDFITVMSITGFKAESIGMAMRGASNNISQATNLIAGPFAGALLGTGALLAAQFIPKLFGAADATTAWTDSLEYFIRVSSVATDKQQQLLDLNTRLSAGLKEKDPFSNLANIKTDQSELKKLEIDGQVANDKMKAQRDSLMRDLMPTSLEAKYDAILSKLGGRISTHFRERLKEVTDATAEAYMSSGPENALKYFEGQMIKLNASINESVNQHNRTLTGSAGDQVVTGFATGGMLWDAEAVNNSQAITEDAEKLSKSIEKYNEAYDETRKIEIAREHALAAIELQLQNHRLILNNYSADMLEAIHRQIDLADSRSESEELSLKHNQRLLELQKEYAELGNEGVQLANEQLAAEIQLEEALKQKNSLKAQETENANTLKSLKKDLMDVDELRMLERMTAEERKAYEWAKKRAEIMITGAASPGELEKIFAQQANFRMAELDLEFKKSHPAYQTAGSSLAQTTASMNSEILRGMGTTKDKDMLSELKAIKEALTNPRGVKLVEVD